LKPTVFVGSSTEGLAVCRALEVLLSADAQVDVWKSADLFKLNSSALDSLRRAIDLYDFAIFVLTRDDFTVSRWRRSGAPRDNVIFELGLFFGRLGPRRAIVVAEQNKRLKIPSDFAGVDVARFDKAIDKTPDAMEKALTPASERIRNAIAKNQGSSELGFVPSTGLAVGYFMNFIRPVCEALLRDEKAEVGGKTREMKPDTFKLVVLLPDDFGPAFQENIAQIRAARGLEQISVKGRARDFPFFVNAGELSSRVLELFDIPTALSACWKAIQLYLAKEIVGQHPDERLLRQRALSNFRRTIENLLREEENAFLRSVVELRPLDLTGPSAT